MRKRTHNQFAAEAALHGVKIPFIRSAAEVAASEQAQDVEIDPAVAEKAMKEAQERVLARFRKARG